MSRSVLALVHYSTSKFLEIDLSEKRKTTLLEHREQRFSAERGKMGEKCAEEVRGRHLHSPKKKIFEGGSIIPVL